MIGFAVLLAMTPLDRPVAYPVRPVWDSFSAFCASDAGVPSGWKVFKPAADISLAFLSADPSERITGDKGTPSTVYRAVVAGRTLFAFRRHLGDRDYCQAYDFEASDHLKTSDWSLAAGPLSSVDERTGVQEFKFASSRILGHPEGAIVAHQADYFPNPDSIGFVGLQLIAFSKEL